MKSISLFTIVIALFIVIASCQKDSNKDLTKRGMLTSHGWKLSSSEEFGIAIPGYQIKLEACMMDDCLTFKPDGTFKTTTGSLKCDPNETDTTGSWSMSEDGSNFQFTTSTYYSLISIDTKSLVLKWEYSGWGWTYTYIPC